MTQLKDLSIQLVTKVADSQPAPLLDEDGASAIAGDNVEELKHTLELLKNRLSQVRRTNSRLLQQVQAYKGNIQARRFLEPMVVNRSQVMCRIRPLSERERQLGARVTVEAVDDSELAVLDKCAS